MTERPNVIMIVMDTGRPDYLGCYGHRVPATPNIDAIAKECIRYTRAYSTAVWTPPAHASLFTGMNNSKHGVFHGHVYLEHTYSTLAEVLASEGYRTITFSNNPWVSQVTGLTRGFEESIEKWGRQKSIREGAILKLKSLLPEKVYNFLKSLKDTVKPPVRDKGAYSTNILIDNWLKETAPDSRPFFMFINYMETHLPYRPPAPYDMKFIESRYSRMRVFDVNQDMRKQWAGVVKMTQEDFRILSGLYDGCYGYLDYRMGELFRMFREKGILDNSILVILSDHGENLGEHNLMDHQLCIYDTLLKIPLMIRYPSKLGTGEISDRLVSIADVFPTLLGLLNIKFSYADEFQGIDIMSSNERKHIFAEYHSPVTEMTENRRHYPPDFDPTVFDRALKSVRDMRYKYIRASDGRHELYDTTSDPGELHNIISDEPETASRLSKALEEWLNSFKKADVKLDRASLDGLVKEQLSALGYF